MTRITPFSINLHGYMAFNPLLVSNTKNNGQKAKIEYEIDKVYQNLPPPPEENALSFIIYNVNLYLIYTYMNFIICTQPTLTFMD